MEQIETATLASEVQDYDHSRGPENAPVILVQYGDLECPACRDFYPVIRRIENRLGNRLRLVFRHFPLREQHSLAQKAAEATEAAAAQDERKFWEMHDRLYEHDRILTQNDLEVYAAAIGLDLKRFKKELNEGKYRDRVEKDVNSAHRNGISGTPTFFINGERYDGPLELEPLLAAIATKGEFKDILNSLDADNHKFRKAIDLSYSGAPAAGRALRDRFSVDEIYQRVTATASEEISRNFRRLFFSGFAAGLIIGASFFGRVVLTTAFPQDPTLLGNLFYPIGFIAIVLGGYQLFTENTLTPVTLTLTRHNSIPGLLRLWGIVLLANVAGAAVGTLINAQTGVFDAAAAATAYRFGLHALSFSWSTLFFKASIAGGLVATMVWLCHAARDTVSRFFIVFAIMIMIPAGNLFHCVTGSFDVLYLVFTGHASLASVFTNFFIPVALGNTAGGVVFVAFVNYAMTGEREIQHYTSRPKLSVSQWILGIAVAKKIRILKPISVNES